MDCDELCEEFKTWLEAREIKFHREGERCFRLLMNGDHGLFQIRAEIEDEPVVLQLTCAIPVRVPGEKVNEVSLILHELNCGLRVGAFQYHQDSNVTAFRMGLPIREEVELAKQFSEVVYTTMATVDDNVRPLLLQFCSTAEVRRQLAKLKPKREGQPSKEHPPRARVDLN